MKLVNMSLDSENMRECLRNGGKRALVPICKNKGDVRSCLNYRRMKLMSCKIEIWESVADSRLREEVRICEHQCGFILGERLRTPSSTKGKENAHIKGAIRIRINRTHRNTWGPKELRAKQNCRWWERQRNLLCRVFIQMWHPGAL